jgi:hypothetical protein
VVPAVLGDFLTRGLAAVTKRSTPLAGLADGTDALLHYIPFLRKAQVMAEDDPQEHEDEHVKDVKKRTETQTSNGS